MHINNLKIGTLVKEFSCMNKIVTTSNTNKHDTVTILLLQYSLNIARFILDATEKVYKGTH